ncbi:MAG: hypothetical protein JWM02_2943 [Frankiales bacterium]|nr:hypothetical protein [Frankiales bacterium]
MSTRTKVLLGVGGALVLISMLVTGIGGFLLAPPKKVLVVTMTQDAVQADRLALKRACGGLPGVVLVKDQGNPAASVQGRFPVRFDIARATADQEIALERCINQNGAKVRGFLSEGDN